MPFLTGKEKSDTVKANETRLAGLYDEYYDRIAHYVYVRIGDKNEAEDIASEVFLKALKSIKSYEGPWQDHFRDIDPSCTLRGSGENSLWDAPSPAWWCPVHYGLWGDTMLCLVDSFQPKTERTSLVRLLSIRIKYGKILGIV